MRARAERREDTRRRLLAAARNRFEAEGFEAAKLRDIAADAGVSVGSVFVHFADKRDLLHAALFDDLEATLDAALPTGPADLRGWLDHLVGAVMAYYAARPGLSRVLLRESLLAEGPWAERFAGQHARVHAAVAARFEAARARGEVRGEAALFALAFVSFYSFGLLAWVQGAHPDPRGLVGRLVEQHLTGGSPP